MIEAKDCPADMVSGLAEIVNSESFVAVPEIVKGIETVFPDTLSVAKSNIC